MVISLVAAAGSTTYDSSNYHETRFTSVGVLWYGTAVARVAWLKIWGPVVRNEWCQRSSFPEERAERRKRTRRAMRKAKEEGEGRKEDLGKIWTKRFGAACVLAGPPKR